AQVLVEERHQFVAEAAAQRLLVRRQEVGVTGQQVEAVLGDVFYEHTGQLVEDAQGQRQVLRRDDRPLRQKSEESEAPSYGDVDRRDAAVGGVHRAEDVEPLGQTEVMSPVNGMREADLAGALASDFARLKQERGRAE